MHTPVVVVLTVIGVLLSLLVLACWWESRSGRPAWGTHLRDSGAPGPRSAARTGRKELGGVVLGGAIGAEMGGGDG